MLRASAKIGNMMGSKGDTSVNAIPVASSSSNSLSMPIVGTSSASSSSHGRERSERKHHGTSQAAREEKLDRVRRRLGDDVPAELVFSDGTHSHSSSKSGEREHHRSKSTSHSKVAAAPSWSARPLRPCMPEPLLEGLVEHRGKGFYELPRHGKDKHSEDRSLLHHRRRDETRVYSAKNLNEPVGFL